MEEHFSETYVRTLKPTSLEWELHQPTFLPYYELVNRQHDLATV
jgi:hypothetical protein